MCNFIHTTTCHVMTEVVVISYVVTGYTRDVQRNALYNSAIWEYTIEESWAELYV